MRFGKCVYFKNPRFVLRFYRVKVSISLILVNMEQPFWINDLTVLFMALARLYKEQTSHIKELMFPKRIYVLNEWKPTHITPDLNIARVLNTAQAPWKSITAI